MLNRRALLGAGLALAVPSTWTLPSEASTLMGLTTATLVRTSRRVALVTPVSYHSAWVGDDTPRIVTYTRVVEANVLAGGGSPTEQLIVTWGGTVGEIGQKVSGEAELTLNEPTVVFLGDELTGGSEAPHRRVVGMLQGAFRVDRDSGRLNRPRNMPALVRRRGDTEPFAVDELNGLTVDECGKKILGVRR
jgi:hypothetical protein